MARILSIDYGTKRTGIAVTDPLQIIATGLDTVPTGELLSYIQQYLKEEQVETIVIGEPSHADGTETKLMPHIRGLIRKLNELFPEIDIVLQDEQLSSVGAMEAIRQSGAGRKKRREKGLVDKIAAVIILQEYLEENKYSGLL